MTILGAITLGLGLFLVLVIVLQHILIHRLGRTLELLLEHRSNVQTYEYEVEITDPHSPTGKRVIHLPMLHKETSNVH